MDVHRLGPWVVGADVNGHTKFVFVASDFVTVAPDPHNIHGVVIALRNGTTLSVPASVDEVFDAIAEGVGVKFQLKIGQPIEQP